ncbi:PRA1 family protein F2-like [Rhodamnia argentea]|uniref:PRA1 family protein n=1 Tax=Rhodamnia argentea TaxID=178133 RepID=A0A8B8Q5A3_9MYRT|nr:PRA1 family protein F2-like [Rhodamnia argentea]
MTTYGTIPSPLSPPPPSNLEFISRAKAQIRTSLATRRPWKEMFLLSAMAPPDPLAASIGRIQTNVTVFRMNYAVIVLAILFLSLLWHPVSLIVFVAMMVAWLFLYFLRDEPLIVLGQEIDDRVVMTALFLGTIVALSFTHATDNIIVALFIGVVVVVAHGALRETDDLMVDDGPQATGSGGLDASNTQFRGPTSATHSLY